jgi:probable F420-dependent oxidoreductase
MRDMHIGAVLPQTEIGIDPGAIRAYAQAVEEMGYDHILAYDHVLGADLATRPDWRGPYNSATQFHEPFVLFGYLAAITQRVELVTGVIILPQRQTALVAKQAAEVDVLSGGRVRLGVGVGWNPVEYAALNEDFSNRGARSEEQIQVLRALWSAEAISFAGRWHHIDAAGINPLPLRRAIPIWLGGSAEATLKRAGKLGDGWFPQRPPDDEARAMVERLREYTRAAGRPESAVGIEARLSVNQVPQASWVDYATAWKALGATHLTINTMGMDYATVAEHLATLQQVKSALG